MGGVALSVIGLDFVKKAWNAASNFLNPDSNTPSADDKYTPAVWCWGDDGDSSWPAIEKLFNFRGFSLVFNCDQSDTEQYPKMDGKRVFKAALKFPNLFQYSFQGGVMTENYAGQNIDEIKAIVTNMVQRPWLLNPPGGLYALKANGAAVTPTAIPCSQSDILDGGTNEVLPNQPVTIPWMCFDVLMESDGTTEDWSKWNTADFAGGTLNVHKIDAGKLSDIGADSIVKYEARFSDVYTIFQQLAAKTDEQGVAQTDFPGSVLLVLTMQLESSNITRGLASEFADYYKATKSLEWSKYLDDEFSIAFKIGAFDDTVGMQDMALVLQEMYNGLVIPIDFTKFADQEVKTIKFQFNVKLIFLNGGMSFNLATASDQHGGFVEYAFTLVNPLTNNFDNASVFSVNWQTQIDDPGSACMADCNGDSDCKTECAKTNCGVNGQPLVRTGGTCGDNINNAFNSAENSIVLLTQTFEKSVVNTLASMSPVLDNITRMLGSIASNVKLSQQDMATLTRFQEKIAGLGTKVNQLKTQILTTLRKANESIKSFDDITSANLCSNTYSVQDVDADEADVEDVYTQIKGIFADVNTWLKDSSITSQLADKNANFSLADLLTAVQGDLLVLDTNNAQSQNDAGGASGGSNSPNAPPLPTPLVDPGSDDNPSVGTSSGFPKWGIYVISAVGAIVVVGVLIGIYRSSTKKSTPEQRE